MVHSFRFPGERQAAGVSFLFAAKKEAKKRHRFDAVDADQGFALDPYAATPPGRPIPRPGGRGTRKNF